MKKTLIKNGTLITAEKMWKADILIDGEIISRIESHIDEPDAEIIDADGMLVIPGGVDPHVHLSLPMFGTISSDDYYTGGKAAAFGGTTTMIDFVSLEPEGIKHSVEKHRAQADPTVSIDYSAHMNVTLFNAAIAEELANLPDLGITSLKMFTAYNNRLRLDDGEIFQVMRIAGKHGMLPMIHAENGDVIEVLVAEALQNGQTAPIYHALTRPAWGEVEASLRAIAIAAQANSSVYLVHMNVAGEVDQLSYGRHKGVKAMGETCPQYLFFSEDDLRREDGAKFVCSPPVRTRQDQTRLWQALESDEIQVLATDHCPFYFNGQQAIRYENEDIAIPGKELGTIQGKEDFTLIPNGLPGLGDRLPVFWSTAVNTGRISPMRFVELCATNPAKIFGLYPQKGTLKVGSDADIAIWDPNKTVSYGQRIAKHRTDHNLYEGMQLRGYPTRVLLRGKTLVDAENWYGQPGGGKFLHRKLCSFL